MTKQKPTLRKKKKKLSWIKVAGYVFFYLLFVCLGVILGMAYQQRLTALILGEALSYTNIKVDVNFNETKLVQELNSNFVPALREALNKTIQNEVKSK